MKKIVFAAAIICAAMFVACGSKGNVTEGSLSKFDSLSYALGANIGYGMNYQMKDVPFDYNALDKGLREGAFGKAKLSHDEAIETLRDYFMTKRPERQQAIAAKKAAADSLAMAQDSTALDSAALAKKAAEPVVAEESLFENAEEKEKVSYAFGLDLGTNIREADIPVQIVWIIEAMKNVREDKSQMTEEQVNQYLQYYFMVKRPQENKDASDEWMKGIEKKSGVKKTASGILYRIVKEGDANVIAKDSRDVVKVNYTGKNRKDKVFDTSRYADKSAEEQKAMQEQDPKGFKEDKPIEFPLDRVIPGWAEGMKLVGKGGVIELWIPSELAYGERGAGRDIGPNEALYFNVEVVDVTPYVEPAPAPAEAEAAPAEAAPAK